MRVHLIYPDWGYFPLLYRRYIPVMGPAIVAALTPSDIEVVFTDERLDPVDFDRECDLVAISMMTSQAQRAYEIARIYRGRGIPVIIGGVHASLMPEEAALHADAVVIGEAENTWPEVVRDFRAGMLRKTYSCSSPAVEIPMPRWEIFDRSVYLPMNSLQISRGCPVNCELCSVPQTSGTEFRMADTGRILAGLAGLEEYLFLVNDNLHMAKRRVMPFLQGLAESGKEWVGLAPLSIAEDPAYLDALRRANCWAQYVDLSPWISAGLNERVADGQVDKARRLLDRIRERGIKVIASFVFGFDHDDGDIFDRTVRFAKNNGIEEAEFHILTPYPRTRLFERLETEGRLLTTDFSQYSTSSVVFRPARMSEAELLEGYRRAWRDFYSEEEPEETEEGPLVRTYACFPFGGDDLLHYTGGRWVDAVRKKTNGAEARG